MEGTTNYETESAAFRKAFDGVKDRRIVLYGIGRYTATLMAALPDYNIIGFMDRDPENIGRQIYGRPILSKEQAEGTADMVIINTVSAYWDTIFKRIQDLAIPVYYRDGQRAVVRESQDEELEYWGTSVSQLLEKIEGCDVISFDVFDTLLARRVYLPKDVFGIVGFSVDLRFHCNPCFREAREIAASRVEKNVSSLDEVYSELAKIGDWSEEAASFAKEAELQTELGLVEPRKQMVEVCMRAMEKGKEVYFLSDMHLPKRWYVKALGMAGIKAEESKIWVSSEGGGCKENGTLWERYKSKVVGSKRALHIGDDYQADVIQPRACGIDTYPVKSGRELLGFSSMRSIVPYICTQYASVTIGLIVRKLLNNPFQLNQGHGKIRIEDARDFGYCVYGPVIQSFLLWLLHMAGQDGKRRLFFLARDGYFLLQDYEYLVSILEPESRPAGIYLPISRRVVSVASIRDEEDFREVCSFPFYGTFESYLDIRFDIRAEGNGHGNEEISLPGDIGKVMDWLKDYREQIKERIAEEKEEYTAYIESLCFSEEDAVVDSWYYGNTQYYLRRLLGKGLTGYYLAANMTPENKCCKGNRLVPCFQRAEDVKADSCQLFKKGLITESFLTAPYGMIKKVKRDGSYVSCRPLKNQETFPVKEEMNEGVKAFIKDFWDCLPEHGRLQMDPDPLFSDRLFGYWMDGGCELSECIRDSFWSDNEMVQKREFKIFE